MRRRASPRSCALRSRSIPSNSLRPNAARASGYVASRLRLTELAPAAVEAFTKDEIGLGHALLLAKLQPQQQEEALTACWQESYTGGSKAKRILLPVRHLREWIEHNILLELATAPFSKEDATLVPEAGSCVDCPKRTGHNTLLFEGIAAQHDSCSDPACYAAKVDAHVKRTVAAKPKLVQITTAYGKPAEGSAVVPRNQYVEIRQEKPKNKYQQDAPEYKTCKYTTEAIVADGTREGRTPQGVRQSRLPGASPQEAAAAGRSRCRDEGRAGEAAPRGSASPKTTGLRVSKAIGDAVPVRLMKRDLLFVVPNGCPAMLDERRLAVLIRQHGIGKPKDGEAPAKLLAAFLPKAEESKLGRILVETVILLSMHNQADAAKILRDAAQVYKVDVDAISATVKQEFAAKEKGKASKKAAPKSAVEAREESSGVTSIQPETSRGASKTGSAFSCPLPVCPPSCDAPDERRGDILAHPTGTAEPLSPGTHGGASCECAYYGKLVHGHHSNSMTRFGAPSRIAWSPSTRP